MKNIQVCCHVHGWEIVQTGFQICLVFGCGLPRRLVKNIRWWGWNLSWHPAKRTCVSLEIHFLPTNSLGITLVVKNILFYSHHHDYKLPRHINKYVQFRSFGTNMAGNDSDIPQNIPSFWQQAVPTLVENIWICFHWHSWKFSRRLAKYILFFSFANVPGVSLKTHGFSLQIIQMPHQICPDLLPHTRLEIAKNYLVVSRLQMLKWRYVSSWQLGCFRSRLFFHVSLS